MSAPPLSSGDDDEFFYLQGQARGQLRGNRLPKSDRALLAAQAKKWIKPRRKEELRLWAVLVDLSVAKPRTLGFVHIEKGGCRSLAEKLGLSPSAATQVLGYLKGWQKAGVLRIFYGRKVTRHAPVVGVQIPWLTESMIALAEMNALPQPDKQKVRPTGPVAQKWDRLNPSEKFPPWPEQVVELIEEFGRSPNTYLPSVETERDAVNLLRSLKGAGTAL